MQDRIILAALVAAGPSHPAFTLSYTLQSYYTSNLSPESQSPTLDPPPFAKLAPFLSPWFVRSLPQFRKISSTKPSAPSSCTRLEALPPLTGNLGARDPSEKPLTALRVDFPWVKPQEVHHLPGTCHPTAYNPALKTAISEYQSVLRSLIWAIGSLRLARGSTAGSRPRPI